MNFTGRYAQVQAFERAGQSPAALVGRTIRVRGLLDMRPGPRIQISGPDSLEVVQIRQNFGPR